MDETCGKGSTATGEEKEGYFSPNIFFPQIFTEQKHVSFQSWFITHLSTLVKEELYK